MRVKAQCADEMGFSGTGGFPGISHRFGDQTYRIVAGSFAVMEDRLCSIDM